MLFGRSCLLSVDYGEWGAWLIEADPVSGKTRRFGRGTGPFVMVHGHLLAVGYRIGEIERAPDGSAKVEQLALGPGAPMAYGLDANGDLVFMARGFGALEPSAPKWPARSSRYDADKGKVTFDDSHSTFVLRLDPAGQLVEVH